MSLFLNPTISVCLWIIAAVLNTLSFFGWFNPYVVLAITVVIMMLTIDLVACLVTGAG